MNFQGLTPLLIAIAVCSCGRTAPVEPAPESRLRLLIPLPVSAQFDAGRHFPITSATTIFISPADEAVTRIGQFLAEVIGTSPGSNPRVEPAGASLPAGSISLSLGSNPSLGQEGYELTISPESVRLVANQPAGLFYGVQTLRQLLPVLVEYEAARPPQEPISLPAVRITDYPRFEWRGAMLDVARHFFSVEEVKRYIDLMALHKMNRLHLHLADDQGWRIEVRSWPNLTTHGGSTEVGGTPGGYYSQQQYAEIVAYARERFVTIVPEIDLPGHTNAALASYPELNCNGTAPSLYTGIEVGFSVLCIDKDVTYKFLNDVIREIASMTPGPYFHAGGDEVNKLTAEQYRRFIERVQDIVQANGKRMIGWDEIAAARLLPTSIVQHWRPEASAASLSRASALILSPANRVYLDMKYNERTVLGLNWAALIEIRDAYDWDPATLVADVGPRALLGVEAPLWSETLGNIRDVEFMAFPRLAAVAEIGWSQSQNRNWADFRVRLGAQGPRWTALGINFYRSPQVTWQ
jgi:hexosaminidase